MFIPFSIKCFPNNISYVFKIYNVTVTTKCSFFYFCLILLLSKPNVEIEHICVFLDSP